MRTVVDQLANKLTAAQVVEAGRLSEGQLWTAYQQQEQGTAAFYLMQECWLAAYVNQLVAKQGK